MNETTGTVRFHRVIRAPRERVYRAFLDPAAMVKWLPPHGFTGTMHAMDARVGGGYRMSFTNFGTGSSHGFSVTYLEMVENTRLRQTDTFDLPGPPGQMEVLVEFREVLNGTELSIVQSGIPSMIPAEFCVAGWQESLALLALLVEPTIPDGA
jgi:uncharacterized protein YndB with AHSA1/START domain